MSEREKGAIRKAAAARRSVCNDAIRRTTGRCSYPSDALLKAASRGSLQLARPKKGLVYMFWDKHGVEQLQGTVIDLRVCRKPRRGVRVLYERGKYMVTLRVRVGKKRIGRQVTVPHTHLLKLLTTYDEWYI